jgi:DnaJ-domain-containing protein 1
MGFDPRRWSSAPRQPRPVTSNLDGLLAENQALRQELQQLRRRLAQLERLDRRAGSAAAASPGPEPEASPHVSAEQVRRWGEQLSRQSGWTDLRSGGEASGLRGLIEALNRGSFHPQLTLEQRLDRLAPGLGSDLQRALAGPLTKKRLAVLAAFALYGISASEWLEDDPARVVADLRQRQQHFERSGSQRREGRRTSSDQRRSDRHSHDQHQGTADPGPDPGSDPGPDPVPPGVDPRRLDALQQLGLRWGASRDAIKTAHRRLVKRHHPDMGGQAADFHRINAAYQLLIA